MGLSNLSSGFRPGICTSTTRPSAPFEGQMIYETDTDRVLVWNGSAWYPNWNTAWGAVGFASAAGGQTVTTVTDMTGMSTTFTAVTGRRYRSTLAIEFYNTNANSFTDVFLTDGSNNAIRGWTLNPITANLQSPYVLTFVEILSSGSITRKIRFGRGFGNTGNVISFGSQQLTIEDLGPL